MVRAGEQNQADAFVDLPDALQVERAPVIGGSAGALSAIQFAIRHPDRCSALVAMVPAAYAPGRAPVRPPNPIAQGIIEYGLKSDFLFWSAMTINEDAMIAAKWRIALIRQSAFASVRYSTTSCP